MHRVFTDIKLIVRDNLCNWTDLYEMKKLMWLMIMIVVLIIAVIMIRTMMVMIIINYTDINNNN